MKVVIAMDSFKGSLKSLEAAEAVSAGIKNVYSDADVVIKPLADGGEGTVEALTLGMKGRLQKIKVTGPLGERVDCEYGILPDQITAVAEMSAAAGITLVRKADRNPLNTTTFGVGEIIKDAIDKGCRHFIIGIGGSATNDGGIGMLQALGFGILDKEGKQVPFGAKGLQCIERITDDNVIPELKDCTFRIACDVANPLCGEKGASAVYGPQKGATPDIVRQMDEGLSHFAALSKEKYPKADPEQAGCGAAGGLGFAFLTYTNAVLESGVKIVLEETRLADDIRDADIVVTGEGRLDSQTVMGKAPIGVARLAKKYGKKVIAFAGCVTEDADLCNKYGIDAFFPILRCVVSQEEAMDKEFSQKSMTASVTQVFRLIKMDLNDRTIAEQLRVHQDENYRQFQSKLLPTIDPDQIIGVRTPILRKMAKQLMTEESCTAFLAELPHQYFEENQLHGFIISEIKDFQSCMNELERFLPYIDNWATCDQTSPKIFKKNKEKLLIQIREWIGSEHVYTVRFAIGMLMQHFLDEDFRMEYLDMVTSIRSDAYYINMEIAWYMATALAKQWEAAIPYLENNRMEKWVHNRTIQKARESYRMTDEQKEYLKRLRQ